MARRTRLIAGTLVLDCEGLAKWTRADQRVSAVVAGALEHDFRVVVSAITPVEAQDSRARFDRLRWFLSRVRVEPVGEEVSTLAIRLLRDAALHGHRHAIDAVVAATALLAHRPVIILTSDERDMRVLCGKSVEVVRA